MKSLDNPPVSIVEETMELWLQRTVTSFETVKAEELSAMITESRASALAATRSLTKANRSPRLNVLRCGKKHTAQQLAGFLNKII